MNIITKLWKWFKSLEYIHKYEVKKMVNLNDLAEQVAAREQGKIQVNICQIKEIMKCLFSIMTDMSWEEISDILRRYKKK